jgi:hypothetical protein
VNAAERILNVLARHLEGPAHIRLLGGAAMILGYGFHRSTEDADLLADDAEIGALIASANFGAALEATNRELEAEGLYLTHIWGPEQQILTPEWRESCRPVHRDWGTDRLTVSVLGPLDLVLSKSCRADIGDLDDIRYLIRSVPIERRDLEDAFQRAAVPSIFDEVFPAHRARILALFDEG